MESGKYFKDIKGLVDYYNNHILDDSPAAGLEVLKKELFPKSSSSLESKLDIFLAYVVNYNIPHSSSVENVIKNANSLYLGDGLEDEEVVPFLKDKGIYDKLVQECIKRANEGIKEYTIDYVTEDYFREVSDINILHALLGADLLIYITRSDILLYSPSYYKTGSLK